MQNRRALAALFFATISGLSFAVACSGSDDDGATAGAGVQTEAGSSDARSDVSVTPLHDGGSFYDPDTSLPTTGDDDDDTTSDGGTCLDPTAIDQTQFRYVTAAPIMPGSCTENEVENFVGYYEANAMFDTFSLLAWRQVVSATCASCIFIDDSTNQATIWRPIELVGVSVDPDVGGCAEHISGSEDCGRAFQQYEDCQNAACINTCTTAEDYAACRADPRMFTTACEAATDAVNTACGEANVNVYEADCNYGTTFEGPIRVGCMDLADGGVPDSGAADAGDAGPDAGDSGTDGGT